MRRVEGKIQHVPQAPESGNLVALQLDNGREVSGDFFFDCTGFRALLVEKILGVPLRRLESLAALQFGAGRAMPSRGAVAAVHAGDRQNGRLAVAHSDAATYGQWPHLLPRVHGRRRGGRHPARPTSTARRWASPRQIRFTAGHRQTFWSKNCIAIGLSAGFLEPLESTSIYLIQEGISRFISLFPDASLPEVVRDEYNRHMRTEFEQVRDFIVLHFSATERDDTPFWNYCRTMDIPDSLRHKIELFREAARVFRYEEELFSRPSWVAVFLGQNIVPTRCDPIVASLPQRRGA